MDAMCDKSIDLEATELRLGLPGTSSEKQIVARSNKRQFDESTDQESSSNGRDDDVCLGCSAPPPPPPPPLKLQIVGWPPIRSYRKNSLQHRKVEAETGSGIYVKVSMDGAPFLRKIDLGVYAGYRELITALENMFKLTVGEYSERDGYKGSEYAPTYEDKDGDWMLVGDVPWEMFASSCKRLRIMNGSEARGLTCSL